MQKSSDQRVIELGRQLFSDPRLSADGKVSCSRCHVPRLAFSDGRPLALGRDDVIETRNTPSLLNAVYLDALFWDGRRASLESQALAPLTNPAEHAFRSQSELVAVIRRSPSYLRAFQGAFRVSAAGIDAKLVTRALAAYERTLLAGDSAFDRYLYGHDSGALSPAAVRGLSLFRGRAGCSSCHAIGSSYALLTDGQYHVSPMGLSEGVTKSLGQLTREISESTKAGNHRKIEHLIATDPNVAALGRFVVTLNPRDIGTFRTPSLRNVSLTAPYMHDGSIATLSQAVDEELYRRGRVLKYPIPLTVNERHDLVAFLDSLTSPSALGSPATK
ncbi:MAG TPA: cytochrome c peroxidase [Steroidobacteraceae bacterium]|nr:cytochrome c peroxidase [Steroidobacteraceae bacterium]